MNDPNNTQIPVAMHALFGSWLPIESAPKDQPILITDGKIWGAAKAATYSEPETVMDWNRDFSSYRNIPNPKAGQVLEYWSPIGGWTVWDEDTEWECGDHCLELVNCNPTHWMPLPPLPNVKRMQPPPPSPKLNRRLRRLA